MHVENMTATQRQLNDVERGLREEILELRRQIKLLELKIEMLAEAVGDIRTIE